MMPLYNYKCNNEDCNHEAVKLVKMDDRNEPIECSQCGSISVRITSIPAPPQFKGNGWTETFYPKKES
jgi:putative FmdB family regulatory protein